MQDLKPDARATNRPIKDKWAVVVGIGNFQEKALNTKVRMDNAAQAFFDYLVDPSTGRFSRNHVRLLKNSQATFQNILAAIGPRWLGQVAGRDDLVVVFITTHGIIAGDGNTYLCAHNTEFRNICSTAISMQMMMKAMRKYVKSDRIVLVIQACHSGAAEIESTAELPEHFAPERIQASSDFNKLEGGRKKVAEPTYNVDLDTVNLGNGYIIITSSKPNQLTWGDIFTNNLVKALKERNGMIPLQEAFDKAKKQTEYDSVHACQGCRKQTPVMKRQWVGKDAVLGEPPIARVTNLPPGVLNYLAAESHYLKANQLASAGKFDEAISAYTLALKTDPKYADAHNDYGSVLALKSDWAGAAREYQLAISSSPEDALFHANYARALAKLGKDTLAQKELETSYQLNPKDRIVLTALADRAIKRGELEGAAAYITKAVELYPASSSLHDRLSYILAQNGDLKGALAHASTATKLDPNSVSAKLNLGSVLLLDNQVSAAVAAYRDAIALDPQNPDGYYLLGNALETAKDRAGAVEALEHFLKVCRPDDPRGVLARHKLSELTQ